MGGFSDGRTLISETHAGMSPSSDYVGDTDCVWTMWQCHMELEIYVE